MKRVLVALALMVGVVSLSVGCGETKPATTKSSTTTTTTEKKAAH